MVAAKRKGISRKITLIVIGAMSVLAVGAGIVWVAYEPAQETTSDREREEVLQMIENDSELDDSVFETDRAADYALYMQRGEADKARRVYQAAFDDLSGADRGDALTEYYVIARKLSDREGMLDAALKRYEVLESFDSALAVAIAYRGLRDDDRETEYLNKARSLATAPSQEAVINQLSDDKDEAP